jgi:hypothetical protein
VVTSPATTAIPVETIVSQATRESRVLGEHRVEDASEIWSATLSGWPMDTDSEVKK